MNDITLMISSEEQFFERGRALARNVDLGKQVVKQNIRSFEDPHDLESFKKELTYIPNIPFLECLSIK